MTLGDRHPVTGSLFTVHLFHVGDWGLLFFPVGWDLGCQDGLALVLIESLCATDLLYDFVQLLGPYFTSFGSFCWLCLLVFCCFRLDEDCIPGRGECGRPLRL